MDFKEMFSAKEPKPFNELLSLKGKVAIVTGGSRGLGRQVVNRFVEAGGKVVFIGRHLEALQKVEAELQEQGYDVACCAGDISVVSDSQKVVDFTIQKYGRLDILVNNAASFPFSDIMSMTEETWNKCFDTDVKGTFFMSQAAAKVMIEQGDGGRIINFLSTAALNPTPSLVAYGAAKQAVWYFTRTMAQSFAPHKITVNAVTPGATMTEERIKAFTEGGTDMSAFIQNSGNADSPFVRNISHMMENAGPDMFGNVMSQMVPMGRAGYPDDLAKAVLFLASDMGEYVTGQNITVDGAQSLQSSMSNVMGEVTSGEIPGAGNSTDTQP